MVKKKISRSKKKIVRKKTSVSRKKSKIKIGKNKNVQKKDLTKKKIESKKTIKRKVNLPNIKKKISVDKKKVIIKKKKISKKKSPVEKKEIVKRIVRLESPVRKIIKAIEDKSKNLKTISNETGIESNDIEKIGLVLEKEGIVDLHYSSIPSFGPNLRLIKKLEERGKRKIEGDVKKEYSYSVDFVPVQISIIYSKEEQSPIYYFSAPEMDIYTKIFLEAIKEKISERINIDASEITDIKKSREIKETFWKVAKEELEENMGKISERQKNIFGGLLMHSMYGLGEIELLMNDNEIEEVAINSANNPIAIYHKREGWLKTNIKINSEEETSNYASQIGRRVAREITVLNPILDAHLPSGDRVNATLNPISSFGNTITIRRFSRKPWTIVDFIGEDKSMTIEMASLLWLGMQYEMNIVVAGGTASGKTSMLNSLSALIPSYHRIISIEDVREITLPDYLKWNWIPLTTRNPNPEGMGEVSMLELMQSSLRMRPDRIIVGEIRRKREAEVLFEAMNTGHSVYSTMHANNSSEVLRRLTESPIDLPALQVEAIDLVLVQHRDRRRNIRRTFEISEIETGVDEKQLDINTVFRWMPKEDSWESVNPASKFVRNLNIYTGMTEEEIGSELEDRAIILDWLLKNNVNDINNIGKIMKVFYSQPEIVKKAAKKDSTPNNIMEV